MSSTTRRVQLGIGLVLFLGLGSCFTFLGYCKYRALYPQDIVGQHQFPKEPLSDTDDSVPATVEYDVRPKVGVSDLHRVGDHVFEIFIAPGLALMMLGLLLIARALSSKPGEASALPATPIDPLTD